MKYKCKINFLPSQFNTEYEFKFCYNERCSAMKGAVKLKRQLYNLFVSVIF